MKIRNLIGILFIGLVIIIVTGAGSYYWANLKPTKKNPEAKKPETTAQTTKPNDSIDTSTLKYSDWDRFLAYEGERKIMIGIKKKYNTVNFRSGPGTEYSIRSTPSGGELLVLIDRVNSWYRARRKNGEIGWIHRSLTRKIRVPLPVVKSFEKNLPNLEKSTNKLIPEKFSDYNQVKVTKKTINLRRGPGTQYSIVNRLYEYERLRLMGKQGKWYRVKNYRGQMGWVYSELVQPIWKFQKNNMSDTNLKSDTALVDRSDTVTLKNSRIRMGPEFRYRKSTGERQKMVGIVLDQIKKWYQVKLPNGDIGWKHQEEIKQSIRRRTESPSDLTH